MRVPDFYKDFVCTADRCRHSCCIGWELDIDDKTYETYCRQPGPFGDRLREAFLDIEEDGETLHTFPLREDKTCPFLNERGLCDIILEMGEANISVVCTEYPRYTRFLGDRIERTLSLSCEEVGRLLFGKTDKLTFVEVPDPAELAETEADEEAALPGNSAFADEDALSGVSVSDDEVALGELVADSDENEAEEDEAIFLDPDFIDGVRDEALAILQDRQYPIHERIVQYMTYCRQVQDEVNEALDAMMAEELEDENDEADIYGEAADVCDEESRKTTSDGGVYGDADLSDAALCDARDDAPADEMQTAPLTLAEAFEERLGILDVMVVLDEEWQGVMDHFRKTMAEPDCYEAALRSFVAGMTSEREIAYEHLMVYFTFRYFSRAVEDADIYGKAAFSTFCWLVIRDMDLLFPEVGQIETARMFSREVEHAEDNVAALMEELIFSESLKMPAVTAIIDSHFVEN
ncbi:MAG: flagellin lysine-N-methylase [Lachnospiraceae bacterium]|nr:flagellin lysine-N-methylase [Lachnospiraceae bacterium]